MKMSPLSQYVSTPSDNESQASDHRSLHQTWLVSVRSLDEVQLAMTAQVGIIDLKEPDAGALSPTRSEVWKAVARQWEQTQRLTDCQPDSELPPLSAALGEFDQAMSLASALPSGFSFAKAGPSGCDDKTRLQQSWSSLRERLHEEVELVAVAYADWKEANSLRPDVIFQLAADCGFQRCLIDTYTKTGCSTLGYLKSHGLRRLQLIARESGMWWALAGSIKADEVQLLNKQSIHPDCYAVRGVVCQGDRKSDLCPIRLEAWKDFLCQQRVLRSED